MGRFSAPKIDRDELDEFRRGARSTSSSKEPVRQGAAARRALAELAELDPLAAPTSGLNLRLNAYQRRLLQCAAQLDGRSQQKLILRILIPALEAIIDDG